jgi:hypothetical protein
MASGVVLGLVLIIAGLFLLFIAGVFGFIVGGLAILAGIAVLIHGLRRRPATG